jgi:hypothetical protein
MILRRWLNITALPVEQPAAVLFDAPFIDVFRKIHETIALFWQYFLSQGRIKESITCFVSFSPHTRTYGKGIAMTEFLSREIRSEFEAARKRGLRQRSRLRVMTGDEVYPILKLLPDGFILDADEVSHLRGLVDVFEGARHVSQCLIIASDVEAGELICKMKRETTVRDRPALDYERSDKAPVGYLPRN